MADWIVSTQNQMGAIIQAPKLTEKLLAKPPFRFLHDIVTAYMKATGQLDGLFTADELNPGKEASKELKLSFLQKVVSVVAAATGKPCPARPAKIIAGAEAEETNEMIRMLASMQGLPKAKVDAAVRATLSSSGSGEPEAAAPAPAAASSSSKPKEEERPAAPPADMQAPAERPQSQGGSRGRASREQPAAAKEPAAAAASVPQVQALPKQDAGASVARPGTASARKAPPAVKSNEVLEERHESVSKAPVAQVISESKGAEDEEEEKKEGEQDWMKLVEREEQKAAAGSMEGEGNARGYLANQAAQAQKEQEEAKKRAEEEAAAAGRSTSGVVLKTRKRDDKAGSSIGASEMTKLREQLQMLTKASNPLGKFLEALHEDVDTMSRELEMWRTESKTQSSAAADARRQTEDALRELHAKQQAFEDAVNEKNAQINILRGTIIHNDKTIDTLVRMVVNPDRQ